MSQNTNYNIANQSGSNFRSELNDTLLDIVSNNSGASEPATTFAYEFWVDTTNSVMKIRNSGNDDWITLPFSITADNTVDVNGGTVNGITSLSFSSGSTVTSVLDEDDLISDSASSLATQQSIKAYVDSQVTAQDLDFQGDSGGALSIDLDSETLTFTGGTGIDTSGSANTITFAIDSTVATLSGTQTLTNKTIDLDNNTVSNIELDNLKSGVLDTDISSVSASDDTIASAKAIKSYVDSQVTAQDLDLTDGTNNISIDLDSESLSILGGTGVSSAASGNGVTLAIGQAVATTDDVTFNSVTSDITGDVTGTVSSLSNHNTDSLSEGSSSLYFTNARARSAVSVSGDLAYNSSTGVFSFTERTDAEVRGLVSASGDLSYNSTTGVFSFTERTDAQVRGLVSASGDLSYNSSTGVFSFTERTDAEVRGLLSGGTGVTYNSSTGAISVGQDISTTSDVTFNDVIVSGDLTVSGTTTTVDTETINLADNIIVFNSNATGTPSENAGIEIERGDSTNKTLIWNESTDKWTVGSETFVAGTFEGALTGNVTGQVSTLSNHDTDSLSEGSTSLYFTNARARSAISASGDISYNSSTGVISFTQSAAPVTSVNSLTGAVTLDTDDIAEGSSLYHTTERVQDVTGGQLVTNGSHTGISFTYDDAGDGAIDATVSLSSFSTADLSENTNLYHTTERVQDVVGGMVTGNTETGITVTYQDADGTLDFEVGTLNQDTTGNAATATALETARTINGTSFDGTANISFNSDSVSEGSTNLYFTEERVDDRVNNLLTAGTGITLTYNDTANTLEIAGSAQYGDSDVESYLDGGTSTPTFSSANITNTSTDDSLLITTTEDSSTAAPIISLKRNSSSPADGDYLGQLKFKGENDADQEVVYAKVTGKISDASDTTEDGLLEFALKKAGSNNIGMRLTSSDLKLINGTGLEVAGLTYPTSDGTNGQALVTDGAGNLSFSTVAVDQTLTVIGRSANVDINITSGTLVVEGRAGNVNVGV